MGKREGVWAREEGWKDVVERQRREGSEREKDGRARDVGKEKGGSRRQFQFRWQIQ